MSLDVSEDIDLQLLAVRLTILVTDLMMAHKKGEPEKIIESISDELDELNTEFTESANKYVELYKAKLNSILFQEMSLDEVRAIYQRPKEAENGQAEDGE